MASESRLNQIVKGAPAAAVKPPPTPPLPPLAKFSQSDKYTLDPHLATLPSSPPQIYLNLLILESSLRAQYLHLVSRRRLNTFFLLLLAFWNGFFFYALFLRPREDGIGLGGSVYWVVETSEKLALMGGIVTVLLVWGTGQWERGIRWPRKWLGNTNRGLRGFNLRVVIIRGTLWRELLGHMSFLLPFGLWREAGGSDWHFVEHETGLVVEEDLADGGDGIMLLLLPKSFSPEFRENWEEYRTEYWEKENERRAGLRRKLNIQRRAKAKETGGWKWWTGAWRLASSRHHRRHHDLEKHPHGHQHTHPHAPASHRASLSEKDPATHSRALTGFGSRRKTNLETDSTHSRSRQSSRSSTAHLEFDGNVERPLSERVRRGSSVSSTASVRRKPRDRKDRDRDGNTSTGTPLGTPLLSPLTSAGPSTISAIGGEDEREERRRRRREREAAKKDRERAGLEKDMNKIKEEHANDAEGESSVPTTPKSEVFSINPSPAAIGRSLSTGKGAIKTEPPGPT